MTIREPLPAVMRMGTAASSPIWPAHAPAALMTFSHSIIPRLVTAAATARTCLGNGENRAIGSAGAQRPPADIHQCLAIRRASGRTRRLSAARQGCRARPGDRGTGRRAGGDGRTRRQPEHRYRNPGALVACRCHRSDQLDRQPCVGRNGRLGRPSDRGGHGGIGRATEQDRSRRQRAPCRCQRGQRDRPGRIGRAGEFVVVPCADGVAGGRAGVGTGRVADDGAKAAACDPPAPPPQWCATRARTAPATVSVQ